MFSLLSGIEHCTLMLDFSGKVKQDSTGSVVRFAKVSAKGAVVIPADLRKKLGIEPGSKVYFIEVSGAVQIVPVPINPIQAARGLLKAGRLLTEELLAQRSADQREEEQRFKRFLRQDEGAWPAICFR